ncbi:SRPBCC family protein [Mycolicibacterium llatzerense]|uniref:SRPBCC family protein n=1 Tax=Mycolicibacterium llatzerense TaxID=280871 RepID=UPI000AFDBBC8|nr:SRPBCC family protein [Mycolicibacterium llatzerense]
MTTTHAIEAAAGVALLYAARRYYRNWGTTKQECRQQLPGDELVRLPALQSTEGILIGAPVDAVWPWLVQLGQDRAGLYTYEAVESLLSPNYHGDRAIRPEWQRLAPGDPVRLTPPGWLGRPDGVLLRVAQVVEKQSIVLHGTPPEFPWDAVWSFHLEPHWENQCRLLARTRAGLRHPGQVFVTELAGPVVALTMRGMLLGIRDRAEEMAGAHMHRGPSTQPTNDRRRESVAVGPLPHHE